MNIAIQILVKFLVGALYAFSVLNFTKDPNLAYTTFAIVAALFNIKE